MADPETRDERVGRMIDEAKADGRIPAPGEVVYGPKPRICGDYQHRQRAINMEMRSVLDRMIYDSPTKGTDPMKQVTITINSIANGVLVSVNPGPTYCLSDSDSQAFHYPTLEAAIDGLPDSIVTAWEAATRNEQRYAGLGRDKDYRHLADKLPEEHHIGNDIITRPQDISSKLPEERAVEVDVPIVDEDDGTDCMIRAEPVMSTAAFGQGIPVDESGLERDT